MAKGVRVEERRVVEAVLEVVEDEEAASPHEGRGPDRVREPDSHGLAAEEPVGLDGIERPPREGTSARGHLLALPEHFAGEAFRGGEDPEGSRPVSVVERYAFVRRDRHDVPRSDEVPDGD